MTRSVQIAVTLADALKIPADVLILKYAQHLFGVDQTVYTRLQSNGVQVKLPAISRFSLYGTKGSIAAENVLFVGVNPLGEFGYTHIRTFSRQALAALARITSKVSRVIFTLHGPGYGLDEIEAFESELAGVIEAITDQNFPDQLESIQFVERDPGRANRIATSLHKVLPTGIVAVEGKDTLENLGETAQETLRTVGYSSAAKPHVFVAMPFAEEMDDIFHYGIQGAVNAAGLLCERADLSTFTGDVIDWVKRRISTAKLVVADLTSANPNVYLEVGYAWGCRVPTVLLAKDAVDLRFDVRGQRCLLYKSIKHLEDTLVQELLGLNLVQSGTGNPP